MADRSTNFDRTHALIPGGAHTYSKGDDQFPANAPRYLERGAGVRVFDEYDRSFIDWAMGLRSMSLGYGCEAVNRAAIEQIEKGSNFTRPSYLETQLAEDLVDLIPCADMVKFAKNGSTSTTAAVKLARAYTGRDMVALCADHPFFSYDDWFIGTTPMKAGVPEAFSALSLTFKYNDLASLEHHFTAHPGKIACVIMEAATSEVPADGFLEGVSALCKKNGAVFILDEMITGFRWHLNGAQHYYNIQPDLATFGKGMGNGFSISVLAGRREIMDQGGIFHDKERVFLISTTHGAENSALAACRAAMKIYRETDVTGHMWRIGQKLIDGLNAAAADAGVGSRFRAFGYPCSPYYATQDAAGQTSMAFRTLFHQEMIERGILMPYVAPSFAHTEADVAQTVDAARGAFTVYAQALDGGYERFLRGPVTKPVFRTYN